MTQEANLAVLGTNVDTAGDVSLTTGVAGTLPVANGGTGLTALGPAFSAYQSNTLPISQNTLTLVPFNTKSGSYPSFDTATCYNNTGSTVTLNGISVPAYAFAPNVAGYYQINALISFYYPASNSYNYIYLYKNTSIVYIANGGGFGSPVEISLPVSFVMYMNGTSDYITMRAFTSSASTTLDGGGYNYFQAFLARTT